MITSSAVSAPRLPHHRRVMPRRAAPGDFAEPWLSDTYSSAASGTRLSTGVPRPSPVGP